MAHDGGEATAVLIVDDNEPVATTAAAQLERRRDAFDVETVGDGETALAMLEAGSYDCLVTDYRMPGLDGLDLTGRVRERSDVPVLLYTRVKRSDVLADALDAGVDEYLRKGTDSAQYRLLADRIDRLAATAGVARTADSRGALSTAGDNA